MPDSVQRPFDLDRRALCLDFLNTLANRPSGSGERLLRYADLLRFVREAQAMPPEELATLEAEAERHPRRAAAMRRAAIALRELLYRVLVARAAGTAPLPADLDELNRFLGRALSHRRVSPSATGLEWDWDRSGAQLELPLWPILLSAAELLTSTDGSRVRECASARCGWMFLDRSRAARRRWCDMGSCGNRAKAKRHYQRQREKR